MHDQCHYCMIKINKTPQTLKVPLADVATSLQSVYQLPHSLVPHLVHDECYQCSWASIHPPRPDLLELATSFRGENNSWGQMRLMERWITQAALEEGIADDISEPKLHVGLGFRVFFRTHEPRFSLTAYYQDARGPRTREQAPHVSSSRDFRFAA